MSQPPEYPGSRRLKRAATRAGGGAYEGAFEAVGSILVATGLGYWFDQRYETTPAGVLVGACIGFAAFVLRLVRLGRLLHPDAEVGVESAESAKSAESAGSAEGSDGEDGERVLEIDGRLESERVLGEELGLSDVLRETDEEMGTNEERS